MTYTNAKDLYRSPFPKSRFKGSSLPQYNNGGSPMSVQPTFLQKGDTFLASNAGKGISAGAGLAGELINQYGGDGAFAAGASGALKGASAGAQFGLIGAGVGALGGAAYGLLMREQELKKEEEAKEQKNQEDLAMNYQTSKAILSTYPTEGVADAGFLAAYGGLIKMDKGGVVQPKGDPYEYKYENGKFLTRKKGSSKWITTSGSAEKAIKEKVFKIKDTSPTDLGLGEAQDPRLQGTSASDNTNVPVNIQPASTQQASTTIVRPTPGGFDMSLISNNTLPSAENVNFKTQGAVEQGYVPKTAEELASGNSLTDSRLNNNNPSDATYVAPVQQDTRDYVAPTITPNQYDASREQVANQMNSQAVQDALSNIEEPAVSGLATKVLRKVLPPVLPFAGKQMIASSITRDSKFGMADAPQGVQNHLISSVINARKRSGKNKGGTQYIDYNEDVHNDIQNMDVKTIDALAGSYGANDLIAATTFGRVSYEYDPKTKEYKVYDNYDFSKLPSKSKKLYNKLREVAGNVGISDKDTKRNLIGTFKEEDYKDLAVENEYGKAKEVTEKLKDIAPILTKFSMGGPTDPPQAFDMSMLSNNPIKNFQPTPQETIGNPNAPVGYGDIVKGIVQGGQQTFTPENIAQAKQEARDFKTNVVDYAIENPLDAAQIGLGTTAIAAGQVPNPIVQAGGAFADVINGGISFGRSAYYGYKGKPAKAAMYAGFGAVDMTAGVPGVAGDMASIAKMKNLYNVSKGGHAAEALAHTGHAAHSIQHTAHEVAPFITGYKTQGAVKDIADNSNPEVNSSSSPTPPVAMNTVMNPVDTSWVGGPQYSYMPGQMAMGGKIPTQSADYLAEGGEVIQHAANDRPDTDQNGGIRQLNSNTSLFKGDSHSAPSQGIGVANDQEARIYSKRLYAPKDLVAKLKSL